MSGMSEPSIITEVNPDWMERKQTAGSAAVVLVQHDGDVRVHCSTAAMMRWRRKGSPAYLRAPAEAWMITGRIDLGGGLHDGVDLLHVVGVERRHAVAVLGGMIQQLSQDDQGHTDLPMGVSLGVCIRILDRLSMV
jgi:hypothetical protein